jgi:hypothetical protein
MSDLCAAPIYGAFAFAVTDAISRLLKNRRNREQTFDLILV